jgi:hypothetical protein
MPWVGTIPGTLKLWTKCKRWFAQQILLDFTTFLVAFGYADGRPFHLVFGPVFIGGLYDFRLVDDARLNPNVVRLGRMQGEYRRTARSTKASLYLFAAPAKISVTFQFGGRLHPQILSLNTQSNIEGASVRSSAILTMAIIRRAECAAVAQRDSATQA